MSRNQKIFVGIGLAISALFLWIAFSGLNPADVWVHIQQAQFGLLVIGVLVYYLAMLVITLRWRFLLRAFTNASLRELYELVAIGYMGNNVYPFRAGEVLRIVLLRRDHQVPLARGTTTVLVERVFDGIVMLTFIIVPLIFIPNASPELRAAAGFTAPIFLAALIVFFVLAARPGLLRRVVKFFTRVLPGTLSDLVIRLSEDVIDGLAGLRNPSDLVGTVIASYATWSIEAVVYWIVSFAFGLDVSYWVMLTVVGAVNLAGLLPASPGQIGVFEFFASRVLIGVGVPETQATAYALLVHVVIWLPPTLLGFAMLARYGLGLSALTRAHELEAKIETSQDPPLQV